MTAERLRAVFMGTPDFAVPALRALAARHEVLCVYTQPPRPAGRGKQPRPSPVQQAAEALGLPVRHPVSLKGPDAQADFSALKADVAVVAAYGLILPQAVLAAPRLGCINVHASLLPRWRGAAPIQRAIMAGDTETGITIMRMDTGLDTGPMLLTQTVPIDPKTIAGQLHDRLAAVGGALLLEALDGLAAGTLVEVLQPEAGVTYAAKLSKSDLRLDWSRPADDLARQVRALAPLPGAVTEDPDGTRLKVMAATPTGGRAEAVPGLVLDETPRVACGDGTALRLERLQRAGKAPLAADAFLRGHPLPPGTVLA